MATNKQTEVSATAIKGSISHYFPVEEEFWQRVYSKPHPEPDNEEEPEEIPPVHYLKPSCCRAGQTYRKPRQLNPAMDRFKLRGNTVRGDQIAAEIC
jgi:hypothetical protein